MWYYLQGPEVGTQLPPRFWGSFQDVSETRKSTWGLAVYRGFRDLSWWTDHLLCGRQEPSSSLECFPALLCLGNRLVCAGHMNSHGLIVLTLCSWVQWKVPSLEGTCGFLNQRITEEIMWQWTRWLLGEGTEGRAFKNIWSPLKALEWHTHSREGKPH